MKEVYVQTSLYIGTFIFPSILTSLLVAAAIKHLHTVVLPPPCSAVGVVLSMWRAMPGFHRHDAWHLGHLLST